MEQYKIKSATLAQVYFVETTEHYYTRYSKDNWYITMGESDEPVYDSKELEKAFVNFNSKQAAL